jgi:hypothetical protein
MMTTCPICGADAGELDRTGDADGFDCPHHGKFKVSRTAMVTQMDAAREKWESALRRGKSRTKPGEWPLVISGDF